MINGDVMAEPTPPPAPKKKASTAPPPIKPVKAGGSPVDLRDPNLSYDDWERARNAELRRS